MQNNSRPGVRTIWTGVVLMLVAFVVVVLTVLLAWRSFGGDAVEIEADGRPHDISLPAGEEYGVFVDEDHPVQCTITDADGAEVDLGPVNGTYELNQWTAERSFDTGDGDLTAACSPTNVGDDTDVRLGPLPSIGALVALILGGICLGLGLGVGGLVVLIIGIVRRSRRPAGGF